MIRLNYCWVNGSCSLTFRKLIVKWHYIIREFCYEIGVELWALESNSEILSHYRSSTTRWLVGHSWDGRSYTNKSSVRRQSTIEWRNISNWERSKFASTNSSSLCSDSREKKASTIQTSWSYHLSCLYLDDFTFC